MILQRFFETLLSRWLMFLFVVPMTVLAVAAVSRLEIDSNLVGALDRGSEQAEIFYEFGRDFPGRSREEVLFVQGVDFSNPDEFDALGELVFELQLTEGVQSVFSVFSIPGEGGTPLLEGVEQSREALSAQFEILLGQGSFGESILAGDFSATLLVVSPESDVTDEMFLTGLDDATSLFADRFEINGLGVNALERDISSGLASDQLILTPLSVLISVIAAGLVLRSWRAAVVCGIPPVIGLTWFLGFLGATGTPMDLFLALVPTVLIVLGLADCVHLYFAVLRAQQAGAKGRAAVLIGLHETWPAAVLTSLTSALAFLSLLIIGSPTLALLAYAGAVGMGLVLLSVLVVFPMVYLAVLGRKGAAQLPRPAGFSWVMAAALRAPVYARTLSLFGLFALIVLFAIKSQSVVGFSYDENIPRDSTVRASFERATALGLGAGTIYAVIEDGDGEVGLGEKDSQRLQEIVRVVYGVETEDEAGNGFAGLPESLKSRDGLSYAVPIPISLGLQSSEVVEIANGLREALKTAGAGEGLNLVGYSLLATSAIPPLIEELRWSFYVALVFIIFVIAIFLRSLRLAFVAIIPNLLPILFVEGWIVVSGGQINISDAIALIVAFGIAVDDSVHFLNRFRLARAVPGADPIAAAIEHTTAPITATTILLLAGFGVTAFSSLPTITAFGILVALALFAAMIVDLFLLPSLLKWTSV